MCKCLGRLCRLGALRIHYSSGHVCNIELGFLSEEHKQAYLQDVVLSMCLQH